MEKNNKSIIESVLYVSGDEGIKVADLKKVLDLATDDIRKLLNEMKGGKKWQNKKINISECIRI